MPELGNIVNKGRLDEITSTLPEISSVSWATAITGKNPGEHGIYGFTSLAPGSYVLNYPNFNSIKKPPFWLNDDFSPDNSKRYAIINTPFTYPARPVNGIQISGFVALDLEQAVYPQSLFAQLTKKDYKVDVDSSAARESMSYFLRDLDNTLDKRIYTARMIWKQENWDIFMLVFTGTDRLSHFLFPAAEDENHHYYEDFINHFKKIDSCIGELYSEIDNSDTIAFMSDHGFESLKYEVFINRYLKEWGFLKLRNEPAKSYNDIDEGTIAFCMDPGRIYLNYVNKYPRGTVKENEADSILNDLAERFKNLEIEDTPVIKEVFRGKDIYHGEYAGLSPDLVLLGAGGFDLKGTIKSENLYAESDIFGGKHTYYDTFFGLKLPDNIPKKNYPEVSTIEDIRCALKL